MAMTNLGATCCLERDFAMPLVPTASLGLTALDDVESRCNAAGHAAGAVRLKPHCVSLPCYFCMDNAPAALVIRTSWRAVPTVRFWRTSNIDWRAGPNRPVQSHNFGRGRTRGLLLGLPDAVPARHQVPFAGPVSLF